MTPAYLKRTREDAGMTREELSAAMGVSLRTVFRWEAGDTPITPVIERALLSVFEEHVGKRTAARR
jgi:transcriptional regulator with XRE-family HTH domain